MDQATVPPEGRSYKTLNELILSIYFPTFMNVVAMSSSIPVIPIFALASTTMVGIIIAAQGAGRMIFNLPSGFVAVRYGDKLTIAAGYFLQMVSGLAMAVSPNVVFLVIAELLMGISQSLIQLGRQSYMKTAVRAEMSGRALSLIGGAARVGGVIGPSLGGFLISHTSVRIALASQAVSSFIALAVTFIFLSDIKSHTTLIERSNMDGDEDDEEDEKLMGNINPENPLQKKQWNDKDHEPDHSNDFLLKSSSRPLEMNAVIHSKVPSPTLVSVWLQYWKSLVVIAFYACTLFMARTARDLVLPLVGLSCGASPTQIGVVSSLSYLIDSSVFYGSGIIMDQAGRKVNAVASPLFYVAGYLQLAFAITKESSPSESTSSPFSSIFQFTNSSNISSSLILRKSMLLMGRETQLEEIGQDSLNIMKNDSAFGSSVNPTGDDESLSIDAVVLWWLVIAALVLGFANGLGSGLAMTLSSDIAPPDSQSRGHFLGIYRMFCDSGVLIGSLLVGVVAEEFSLFTCCIFCAGASLSATLQALFCLEETLPPNTPTAKFFRKLLGCGVKTTRSSP